jgi:hypothetical protein
MSVAGGKKLWPLSHSVAEKILPGGAQNQNSALWLAQQKNGFSAHTPRSKSSKP